MFHYQLDIIKSDLRVPSIVLPPKPLGKAKEKPSAAFMNLTSEFLGKYNDKEFNDKSRPIETWYPSNLVEIVKFILDQPEEEMRKPEFDFHYTQDSAIHNWKVIEKYNKNFVNALESQHKTQLSYGSEFRPTNLLRLIFGRHPLWSNLKEQLENGINYPIDELDFESRKKDLIEGLERGNHKGVVNNNDLFNEIMQEEVEQGWQLIIPRDKLIELEGALLAPMNIQDQNGINEHGIIIPKKRLSHDQSFKFQSGTSVNSRVRKDELQDAMYGKCILRIIHHIVQLRAKHQKKRILIQKIDWKGAYRRGHLNANLALQTCTQSESMNYAFIGLRMTFGGAPNPNKFGDLAEPVCDLTNALFHCKDWDHNELFSPIQSKVPPFEKVDTSNEPFEQALPLCFTHDCDDTPKADCYIDDATVVSVDINDNCERAEKAALLALHIFGRSYHENDPIVRKDLVSLSKLQAEAKLEEEKLDLGWIINTRSLRIILPDYKFIAWTKTIDDIIKNNFELSHSDCETLVGRLGNASFLIPSMKHFMSRLREELELFIRTNRTNDIIKI